MDKGASIVSYTTYWDSNNGINVDSVDCQFDFFIHMSLLEQEKTECVGIYKK